MSSSSNTGQDSHLYWVGCNRCGARRNSTAKGKMFLVNCGCMLCPCCAQEMTTQAQCQTCDRNGTKLLPIGNNLPQQLRELFNPNEEYMFKLNQKLKFQQMHFEKTIQILSKISLETLEKAKCQEQAIEDKQNQLRQVEAQIRDKEQVVARLRSAVANMKQGSGQCQRGGPHHSCQCYEGNPPIDGGQGQVKDHSPPGRGQSQIESLGLPPAIPYTFSRLNYQPNLARQPGALKVSRQHKENA